MPTETSEITKSVKKNNLYSQTGKLEKQTANIQENNNNKSEFLKYKNVGINLKSVTSPSTREEQDSSVTLMELKNLIIKNNSEQQKQMVRLEETMRVGFEALIETIQKGFQAQSETIQKGFQAQSEAIKEGFQAQSEAIKEGFQAQSETIKEVFEAQTKIIEQLVTTPNTQKIERLERRILELEMKKTSEGTSEDLLWYCGPCDKETDHKSAECFRFGGRTPKED